MQNNSSTPGKLLILVSLIQGLCLLFLHQAIELKFWPYHSPQWLFSFYSIAFVGPTMLLLGLRTGCELAVAKWVAIFTLIAGLLGFYVGYQATPLPHIRFDTLLFTFIVTMSIATFKALMYVQQRVSGEALTYSRLFRWSWRNFLTLFLSLLFALCFWGVLMLWAGLFKAIKINFFYDLFTERWFHYPAIALANGFGIIMFRNLSNVIDMITRLQQALMKFLLVMLVLVSLLFLSALPISGLAPLWETGGSALILWMQAIMLFFVNAVYQDDPETRPYHLWLHRFIYAGVALLPIYTIISFYGLSLRVDQYGWSLARCWAFLIWLMLGLFSLGYLWSIIKHRDNWLRQLSKVNVAMGLVVLTFMLVVNSPLLDFRKIVVNSQLLLLKDHKTTVGDFDIRYFRRHLARPGYLALEDLKIQYADEPEFIIRINSLYTGRGINNNSLNKEEFVSIIQIISGEIPDSLIDHLYKQVKSNPRKLQNIKALYLLPVDANENGETNYLYIEEQQHYNNITLFFFEDNQWLTANVVQIGKYKKLDVSFIDAIKSGEINTVKPKWKEISIEDFHLQIRENRH